MSNSHNEQDLIAGQDKFVEVPVKVLEGIFKDLGKDVENVAVCKRYLLDLSNGIEDDPARAGICYHLRQFWISSDLLMKTSPPLDIVSVLSPFWSEYSGNYNYPVPYEHRYKSAREAFYVCEDLWSGEYGEARKRLCKFLADQLEHLLILVEQGVIKNGVSETIE